MGVGVIYACQEFEQRPKESEGDQHKNDPDHIGRKQTEDPSRLLCENHDDEKSAAYDRASLDGRKAIGSKEDESKKNRHGWAFNEWITMTPQGLDKGENPRCQKGHPDKTNTSRHVEAKGIPGHGRGNDDDGERDKRPLKAIDHRVVKRRMLVEIVQIGGVIHALHLDDLSTMYGGHRSPK